MLVLGLSYCLFDVNVIIPVVFVCDLLKSCNLMLTICVR